MRTSTFSYNNTLIDQPSSTEHGVNSRRVSATLAATTGSATNNYSHWPRTTSTNFALNYKVTPADCGTGQNTTRSQLVMSRHSTGWQSEDSTEMFHMTLWHWRRSVPMEWSSRPRIVTMMGTASIVHNMSAVDSGIRAAHSAISITLVVNSAGIPWAAVLTTFCWQVACGLFVASRPASTDSQHNIWLSYFKSQHSHSPSLLIAVHWMLDTNDIQFISNDVILMLCSSLCWLDYEYCCVVSTTALAMTLSFLFITSLSLKHYSHQISDI